MHVPLMTKYIYQIRSRNGAVVDNLQIYGRTEEEARRKLEQMYRNCVILETRVARPERAANSSYEEVLSLIAGHR
jgi:DNA-nicking Smr family endonuclease